MLSLRFTSDIDRDDCRAVAVGNGLLLFVAWRPAALPAAAVTRGGLLLTCSLHSSDLRSEPPDEAPHRRVKERKAAASPRGPQTWLKGTHTTLLRTRWLRRCAPLSVAAAAAATACWRRLPFWASNAVCPPAHVIAGRSPFAATRRARQVQQMAELATRWSRQAGADGRGGASRMLEHKSVALPLPALPAHCLLRQPSCSAAAPVHGSRLPCCWPLRICTITSRVLWFAHLCNGRCEAGILGPDCRLQSLDPALLVAAAAGGGLLQPGVHGGRD